LKGKYVEEFKAQYMTMKKKIGRYEPIKKFMQVLKKHTIIETIRLNYVGLSMYREWKKMEFPKGYYI
jgi:hypothetical protein